MDVKVSVGEAIDKYNILELKMKKISDDAKKIEIQKELDSLHICSYYKLNYAFYYNMLTYANEQIWIMTDIIKTMSYLDSSEFALISNQIFEFNQKRFRIKNWFNLMTSSKIKEQKSYASSHCKIVINEENTIYNKIAEINYLALDYDIITFESDSGCLYNMKNIFTIPTFIYDNDEIDKLPVPNKVVELHTFCIGNPNLKKTFEFAPITYLGGGLLGDFIQSLSVINEKFYQTGRKGILYISDRGDAFRNGLENTYNDTYEVIIKQRYIEDYKIFDNQEYECDLTIWRNHQKLFHVNWYELYKEIYDVEWGTHPWLDIDINVDVDEKWKDVILINTTDYRWPFNIDFNTLYKIFPENMIFIGSDINQYNVFKSITSLDIKFHECNNFTELCIAIKSCKLFVGSLSAPLSIAHAVYKDRISGFCNSIGENNMNTGLHSIWKNIWYSL
jgi:hypothetical protein